MSLVATTLQQSKTLLRNGRAALSQVRYHHPDPFSPKATKGWKAALMVSIVHNSCAQFSRHSLTMCQPFRFVVCWP